VLSCSSHVLYKLLPGRTSHGYQLRQRPHDRTLAVSHGGGDGSLVRRVIGPKNHCELRGTASLKHWTYCQGHQHLGAVA